MANKLKDYVRLDSKNQFVIGSNIKRRNKPVGRFVRIFSPNCCNDELRYTPADVTGTGTNFNLLCDGVSILQGSFSGVITTVDTMAAQLNTHFGSFMEFAADGTEIVLTLDLSVFSPTCGGQLTFTAEAV